MTAHCSNQALNGIEFCTYLLNKPYSKFIGYWWGSQIERDPLGRPRRRSMDNIKMDLREIGWDGMDWIDLAQDRDQWRALLNTIINLLVP
jgi:hypothetical protein